MVDARKQALNADAAWALLRSAKTVTVAKGKKFVRFDQPAKQKDELLKQAIGPTGNLRAPTYRAGEEYVVDFNPEFYASWVK